MKCEYCGGAIVETDLRCGSCGAPVSAEGGELSDYRTCPFCKRRLLALGSPACNYCGRRLPDSYIKAREADLKRLAEVRDGGESSEVSARVDELIRQISRGRGSSSESGLLDIPSLTDLLS